MAIQPSRRDYSTRHVQFHEIPIPRLRVLGGSEDVILAQYISVVVSGLSTCRNMCRFRLSYSTALSQIGVGDDRTTSLDFQI